GDGEGDVGEAGRRRECQCDRGGSGSRPELAGARKRRHQDAQGQGQPLQKSLNRSGAISVSRTVTLSAVGAELHARAKPLMLCGSLTLTVTIPVVLDTRVRGAPARAGLWVEGNVKIELEQDGGLVRRKPEHRTAHCPPFRRRRERKRRRPGLGK